MNPPPRPRRVAALRPRSEGGLLVTRVAAAEESVFTPIKYRLIYFNVRGIVESVRLLLVLVGTVWEDCRYEVRGFSRVEAEFLAHQSAGQFKANMGSVPILEIRDSDDDVWILGQSSAMLRFLAHRYGRFGANEKERALIDAILEHVRDIQLKWFRAKRRPARHANNLISYLSCLAGGQEHMVSDKQHFLKNDLSKLLIALENALPSHNPLPWIIGLEPSLADLAVYHLLATPALTTTEPHLTASFFDGDRDYVRTALARAPRLRACVHAFAMLPSIRHWELSRPSTLA